MFAPLVRGAAWSIGGKLVQLALTLVSIAVIARLVGPEAYGVFALSWIVVGLFEVIVSSAPMETLVQRKENLPGHLDVTLLASLLLAAVIAGGIWLTADIAAHWLSGGPLLAATLPVRAAVLPLQALAVVPSAILVRTARFKAAAGAETVASACSNMTGVALAWAGAGVWSLIAMELTRASILCVALYALTHWRPSFRMRLCHLTDLLAFNVSTWGSWGLGYLSVQLPRFFIASTFGVQAMGFYALAQRLYDQATYVLMVPAYQTIQAGMAGAPDPAGVARRLGQATLAVTAVVACPLYLGLAAVAPILVPALFGELWKDAVPVVQVVTLLGVLRSISVIQAAIIRAMGKPHWEVGQQLLLVVVTAVLVVLALPFGLPATAAAVVASSAMTMPVGAILVRRLTGLPIRVQVNAVARAGAASLVMVAVVWAIVHFCASLLPPLVSLTLCVCAGAPVYWAGLRWSMPEAAQVIENIARALARRDADGLRASLAGPAA